MSGLRRRTSLPKLVDDNHAYVRWLILSLHHEISALPAVRCVRGSDDCIKHWGNHTQVYAVMLEPNIRFLPLRFQSLKLSWEQTIAAVHAHLA